MSGWPRRPIEGGGWEMSNFIRVCEWIMWGMAGYAAGYHRGIKRLPVLLKAFMKADRALRKSK